MDSDQFQKELYQKEDFLNDVFNNNYLKRTYQENLPNLLEELFYSIYIMNPDNSFNSPFNANNKRDALHYIEEYLLSNGYDYTHLGLDEKELFDNYEIFMTIIKESLRITVEGESFTITSRSLDAIESRIWYRIKEYNFLEIINNEFGRDLNIYLKAKIAYQLRNIFKIKSRNLIDDFGIVEGLMRERPPYTYNMLKIKYNNNPNEILMASMRGDTAYDVLVKRALLKNSGNPKNDWNYRTWCNILGIEYKVFKEEYLSV